MTSHEPPVTSLEQRIARLLAAGVLVAVALLAIGVALLLVSGRSPLEVPWPAFDARRIPADLAALRPEGFLWSGLVMTLVTPLLRVTASVVGFAITGERRMALLGIAVLAILVAAIVTSVSLE